METILLVTEVLLGLIVVVSILMQKNKADALSGLIQGSRSETFFAKNKSKTKDSMLVRTTACAMALFMINTVLLNII